MRKESVIENEMSYLSRIKFLPFYAVSILPMSVLYMLSDILFFVVYHLVGYRKKVVRDNLQKAFPYKSQTEIFEVEKKFYHHFCDVTMEAIKTLTKGENEMRKRLVVRNPDLIQKLQNERQSILLYAAHQGNWEWLVALPLYFNYPSYTFYRPLQNNYFDGLFRMIRERFGVNCIESNNGYKTVLEQYRKRVPVMYCLIGDQSPTRRAAKCWCKFFNRKTAFYTGAEKIARRTGAVVVFPSFRKIKRGYYELEFKTIEQKRNENGMFSLIDGYAAMLEHTIIKQPELWLWSHRRWKLDPPEITGSAESFAHVKEHRILDTGTVKA